jgi:hypothetical protein
MTNTIPTPDPRWRTCAGKTCRYTHCGNPAVAEFERSHGCQTRWHPYCERHLYGRVIIAGVVMRLGEPNLSAMLGK